MLTLDSTITPENFPDLSNERNEKIVIESIEDAFNLQSFSQYPVKKFSRVNDNLLRYLYTRCSRLRECIDGIANSVSTRKYFVYPEVENINQDLIHITNKFAKDFFSNLNPKNDNFTTFVGKVVRDLLVFGRSVIEKIRNRKRQLIGLIARDPSNFIIVKDEYGQILQYKQVIDGKEITFDKNDIIYIVLNPVSYDDYGLSPIEGILDEVASLILSTRMIANIVFDDSIPPGILVLGEIGEAAYKRLKEEFANSENRYKLKVIRNIDPNDVKWVQFNRDLVAESKIDELVKRIDDIIYKAFKIPIIKQGALVYQDFSKSSFIPVICKLLEEHITNEVFYAEFNLPIRLKILNSEQLSSQEIYDYSRALSLLVNTGIMSHNEARLILGLEPKSGANKRFGKLGNEYVIFDENTGMPKRLPDFLE